MIERTSEFWSPNRDESTTTMDRLVIENENLRRKLQTLPVIEQAKGILMGHYGIPAEAAFEMLRRWSQDTNTKLHLVAETIICDRCQGEAFGSSLHRSYRSAGTRPVRVDHPVLVVDASRCGPGHRRTVGRCGSLPREEWS